MKYLSFSAPEPHRKYENYRFLWRKYEITPKHNTVLDLNIPLNGTLITFYVNHMIASLQSALIGFFFSQTVSCGFQFEIEQEFPDKEREQERERANRKSWVSNEWWSEKEKFERS